MKDKKGGRWSQAIPLSPQIKEMRKAFPFSFLFIEGG
jgi:hypothetical protein